MDCSMPDFPVLFYLPELAQTYVHESVMPSNHLTLSRPLILLPSIFPSISVFSNELALCLQWPKYWSTSPSTNRCLHTIYYAHMHKLYFSSVFNTYGKSCLGLALSKLIHCLYLVLNLPPCSSSIFILFYFYSETKESEHTFSVLSCMTWIWVMCWSEQARLYFPLCS